MKLPWVSRKRFDELLKLCHNLAGEASVCSGFHDCPEHLRKRLQYHLPEARRLLLEYILRCQKQHEDQP